ncbi:MAG TPA: hypothetical protein VFH17_07300, partial [Coriobacteriia bacterium]|nr:hypothetical protein [Coriobacteriia bacterium]
GGTHAWQPGNHRSWSDALFEDCEFGVPGSDFGMAGSGTGARFVRCVFGVPFSEDSVRGFMETTPSLGFMPRFDRTAIVAMTYVDCRWPAAANLDARYAVAGGGWLSPPSLAPATRVIIANYNANPNDQRIYTPDGIYRNDTVTFRSAPYSLRYTAYSTNRPQEITFQVLAPHNAQVLVAGFLRRDTAYIGGGGTVVVTLSGAGITPVTHTSTGAADAWEPFAFSVVQTTGFAAVLTLSITFRGSAGNAWVDDIVAPATQAISTGEFSFWADGQPIGAILANFSPAADVWAIALAALNVPGSIGEALSRVDTVPGGATINIRQALRALLAESAGNVTGAPTAPEFWSLDGTRVRIAGTATPAGNRTRSLLDLS